MTFIAHSLSSSILSLMIAGVEPSQTGLVVTSLLVPAALDLDHLVMFVARRKMLAVEGLVGNLHKARSFMHELIGVFLMGLFYLWLRRYGNQMATVVYFSYLIHVIEDMSLGVSFPFFPIYKKEVRFFRFSVKQKVLAELATIIISLYLWARYLNG